MYWRLRSSTLMLTVMTLLSAMTMAVAPEATSCPSVRLRVTTVPVMGATAEKFSRFFCSSSTFLDGVVIALLGGINLLLLAADQLIDVVGSLNQKDLGRQ